MTFHTKLGLLLTAVWIIAFGVFSATKFNATMSMEPNEWGDFFAGFSAPLALIWLVLGFFQQGKELQLNTAALKAQLEELRQQVAATNILAENAERQAVATETIVDLNKAEQEREAAREKADAQPRFVAEGGSTSGGGITTKIYNRGAEIFNVRMEYEGAMEVSLAPQKRWANGAAVTLSIDGQRQEQDRPFRFAIIYEDRFDDEHRIEMNYIKTHHIEPVEKLPPPIENVKDS